MICSIVFLVCSALTLAVTIRMTRARRRERTAWRELVAAQCRQIAALQNRVEAEQSIRRLISASNCRS